jgi:alpha-1,3-mannosyltransferase
MKVVFTTTIYLPHMGGIEVCIHEMAQYLISKGHQVKILVADTSCYEIKKETIENELVIRYPAREICNFFVLKRRKYLRDIENEIKDADVVHINVCKFLLGFLSRKKRIYNYKLIMTSHGWIFHTNTNLLIKKIFFKLVVAKNAKYCDSIINVSNQDQKIAESFGIKNSYVILNGVDLKKFSNIPPKSTFENKFLYFGRISANKGIYECLQ